MVTGGEPLLQLDDELIDALHRQGFEIAVETNGTCPRRRASTGSASAPRPARRWSSAAATSSSWSGRKQGIDPDELLGWDFDHFLVQPMDVAGAGPSFDAAIELVMRDPRWRLSIQTHKVVGLA